MKKKRTGNVREELIPRIIDPWGEIRNKLENRFMTVSDVLKLLHIKSRQLLYWYLKSANIYRQDIDVRKWKRFSRVDLFCFSILKELRQYKVPSEVIHHVVAWLVQTIHHVPLFILYYIMRIDLLLYLFPKTNFVMPIININPFPITVNEILCEFNETAIAMPLYVAFTDICSKTPTDDFSLKIIKNKRLFIVNTKAVNLDLKPEELIWIEENYRMFQFTCFMGSAKLSDKEWRSKFENFKKKYPGLKFRTVLGQEL